MGTKRNPGRWDCYAAAEPDEPMFVLLARDELAPHVVAIWACLRNRDWFGLHREFAAAVVAANKKPFPNAEKELEAWTCVEAMHKWLEERKNSSNQTTTS